MQSALILLIGMQIQNANAAKCTINNTAYIHDFVYPDNEPIEESFNTTVSLNQTIKSRDIRGCVISYGKGETAAVSSGGLYTIESGGIDSTVTIKSGGKQIIKSGGQAYDSIIQSGGTQTIELGGSSDGAKLIGGQQLVYGTATNSTISTLGATVSAVQTVYGTAQTTTIQTRGEQIIEQNGTAKNTHIKNGGWQTINSGGKAEFTTIDGGGTQEAKGGSRVENTTIKAGGKQTIFINSESFIANVFGNQFVYGKAHDTTIEAYGNQIIAAGEANNTTIKANGKQIIHPGATSTIARVVGMQEVHGAAISSTITYGGTQTIEYDGIAKNTVIEAGGQQDIKSGGKAEDTTVNASATQIINKDGTSTVARIEGRQEVQDKGTAISSTIASAGRQTVKSGGIAKNTTIEAGGQQEIESGAQVENTSIKSGAQQTIPTGVNSMTATIWGTQIVSGTATSSTIEKGGAQSVLANGVAENTTINSGGTQTIASNATSNTATIWGTQIVSGTATSSTIEKGGAQSVLSNGVAENTTINSDGTQTIASNATSNTATVFGAQIVSGIARNSTIKKGGTQSVLQGGIAKNSTIEKDGVQSVLQGAVAEDTIVEGEQIVDGMARRITIKDTGRVLVNPDGQFEGDIINNGQLTINNTSTKTYADIFTGSGILEKKGDGLLIINGASSAFKGTTKIVEGTIKLGDIDHKQAQLGGNIEVQTKGTLRGHGTVLGNVTNNGTVKPGGTIGKLRVSGNYVQSNDASLIIEMTPQDGPSQLVVSGEANLNGNLYIVYAPGTYKAGKHTLITAGKSVIGTFSAISHKNDDGKAHEVPYENNGVDVFLSEDDATDRNGDVRNNPENRQHVAISGPNTHIYSNLSSFTVLEMQQFANFVMNRRNTQNAYGDGSNDSWARLLGANTRYGNMRSRQQGFMFGIDRMINQTGFGLALAYDETDFSERNSENKGSTNNIRLGIHANRQFGKLIYSGAAIYTHGRTTQNRIVDMVGTATQKHKGHGTAFDFKVSAPFEATNFNLVPYAGISYSSFRGEDFKETGISDVYLLSVTNNKAKSTQFQAGLSLNKKLGQTEDAGLFSLQLGWNHELGSVKRYATTISQDSTRFRSEGNDLPSNLFSIGAQFQFQPSKFTTVSLGGNYTVGNKRYSQTTLQAKVKYLFH